MSTRDAFVLGALVMSCAIAGIFFIRFWRRTHDRLFAIFAAAFWLLGLNWLLIFVFASDETRSTLCYVLRLVAFLLILLGIIDKNRSRSTG